MGTYEDWLNRIGALPGDAMRWCSTERPGEPQRGDMAASMAGLIEERREFSWFLMAGRGFGKTRTERADAEAVLAMFIDRLSGVQSSTHTISPNDARR